MSRPQRSRSELVSWLLRKLKRSGCWGGVYKNKDDIYHDLKNAKDDLGVVRDDIVPGLLNKGLLLRHKNDTCYSLNTQHKERIKALIRKHYPYEP